MKNIFKYNLFALIFLGLFFIVFTEKLSAQIKTAGNFGNYGLDRTMENSVLREAYEGQQSPSYLVGRVGSITGIILSFVGLLFLVLVIYSGILWMTAHGNDQQVERSKKIITWSLIGLFIIFSSFALVRFLGDQLTRELPVDNIPVETEVLNEA